VAELRIQMRQRTFSLVAGVIFLFVAVMHFLRLLLKWEVIFAGRPIPMWVSAVAFVIAAYLGYEGCLLGRRGPD
jgi:hypothetical protein